MSYLVKNQGKYWQLKEKYYCYDSSKWKIRLIKSLGSINKREADVVKREYDTNRLFKAFDINIREKTLLSVAIQKYLDNSKAENQSDSYIKNKMYYLKALLAFVGDMYVSDFTRDHYEGYRIKLQKQKDISFYAHNLMLRIYKAFFNYLVDNEYIVKSPIAKVSKMREIELPPEIPTQQQLDSLISNAPEHLKCIIFILAKTGMRKNELLNLKINNVDIESGMIMVVSDKQTGYRTKNRRFRRVPIALEALEKLSFLVKNYVDPNSGRVFCRESKHEYLFCHRNGRKMYDFKVAWNSLRRRVSMPHLKVHHLRHYACSEMYSKTKDLFYVKEVLGHSDVRITQRYCHHFII